MGAAMVVDRATRIAEKLRREFGPLVLNLMEDSRTEDIVLNPDESLWVYRTGEGFVPVGQMSEDQAYSAVGTIASCRQAVINHDHPILETELALNGARFEAIVPPVVRKPVFAIRMRPRKIFTLDDYRSAGILTKKDDPVNAGAVHKSHFIEAVRDLGHAEIIERAVGARMNILAVGATGSGKTTLANAVLDVVARVTPKDRVVTVEDTIELQCAAKNFVDLRAIGKVSLDDCVRACLRLRPTRVIVGEVRGAEALKLLKSWATGHPGGVATVHSNDARAGLIQLENLVAEATSAPKQALIAETIHLVVFIDLEPNIPAGRKVREVAVVTGYEEGRYVLAYV
jgi:P-type conjugative transfer ATPase TrbB